MVTQSPEPDDKFSKGLRHSVPTRALPIAVVIFSVELQRHWGGESGWILLSTDIGLATLWLANLMRSSWAAGQSTNGIDAGIGLLLCGTIGLFGLNRTAESYALASSLTFWIPLICLWWSISHYQNIGRLTISSGTLLTVLWFFNLNTDQRYPEYAVLVVLLMLSVRKVISRSPLAGNDHRDDDKSLKVNLVDVVTGFSSAQLFETELAQIAAVADRFHLPISLIICEIRTTSPPSIDENSRSENEMLKHFGWVLTDCVRLSDTICRWEHWKFPILLPGTTLEQARVVMKKIELRGNAELQIRNYNAHCCCGISERQPGEDYMLTFSMAEKSLDETRTHPL